MDINSHVESSFARVGIIEIIEIFGSGSLKTCDFGIDFNCFRAY